MPAVARHHYLAGTALYKKGNHAGAAREFTAAFQAYPSSRLLYDLAQAERKQGQLEQALHHYEQFLWNDGALNATIRGAVHGYMARIKSALAHPEQAIGQPPRSMPELLDPALGPAPKPGAAAALAGAASPRPPAPAAAPGTSAPSVTASQPTGGRWEVLHVAPELTLRRVFAQDDAVFAVGDSGIFFVSLNHGAFRPVRSGAENWLASVWGSGGELFMSGEGGIVLRRFGGHLKGVPTGTSRTLFAVGGSAVEWFAVGDGGTAVRWSGTGFAPVRTSTHSPLFSVFGADGDVIAVGASGTIVHWTGSAFVPMASGTTSWLHSLWGTGRTDLFAVGAHGTILHYDGHTWKPQPSGTSQTLLDIWGRAHDDVYAVGSGGTVLHYDGTAWGQASAVTHANLFGVVGSGAASAVAVYAVGDAGTILRFHPQ